MRIMGLDLGDKTIGIAISDLLGITAQGKGVIRRQSLDDDLDRLQQLVEDYQLEKIIVGLPKNMNGSLGARARVTLKFIEALRDEISLPVITWDERLTTAEAERNLIRADVSRSRRKRVIDKLAAVIILQSYLDCQARKEEEGEKDE